MSGYDMGRSGSDPRRQSPTAELRRAMGEYGTVLAPHDAEEPILAPAPRAALFEWLAETRAADDLRAVGLKPRNSALLTGPPGCGKTTYAHHLAARLGVPMLLVGCENLFGSFMGESEKRTAELFTKLEACKVPCVLLLDEIDAIGGKRSEKSGFGEKTHNSVLTVLLRHVEAFNGTLVATTNMASLIDPALWRRFGLQVEIDLPGEDERWSILKRYLAPFEWPDKAFDLLCGLTDGASPALLRGLMEGVKRALVVGPRINRPADDPAATIGRVIAGLRPPPEIAPPPLWASADERAALSSLPWPPTQAATPKERAA